MAMRILAGILIGGSIGAVMGYYGKCQSGSCPLTATPFRGSMYGAVLGVLFSLSTAAPSQPRATAETKAMTNAIEPQHISGEKDFQTTVLEADRPCLVDFFSTSCPPCRRLAPTIDKLATQYEGRAIIAKASVDASENMGLAERYGISSIPAVLFFDGGKEVDRLVGLRDEKEYAAVLDRLARDKLAPAGETADTSQTRETQAEKVEL